MSWAKLCDTLHTHPKAHAAGLEAMGLWVLTLSYVGAYLTDGHIPLWVALSKVDGKQELLQVLSRKLVDAGLWDEREDGDGWNVHQYLEHNPTREYVLAERARKSEAGKLGAAKRWGMAQAMAPAIADAIGGRAAPVPSRPARREPRGVTATSVEAHPQPPAEPASGTVSAIPKPPSMLERLPPAFDKAKVEKARADGLRGLEGLQRIWDAEAKKP